MKLLGLLCWYDERPQELSACVASLAELGVDHVVALDGAYTLYPDARASSPVEQHMLLREACAALGMGLTLHVPARPWIGGEPQKRTTHFAIADAVAEDGDWFIVMDADQVTPTFPTDLKRRLEESQHDAAVVTFCDGPALAADLPEWQPWRPLRILFRAQPIEVVLKHFHYVAADGRVLWDAADTLEGQYGSFALTPDPNAIEPLDLLNEVVVLHRPQLRAAERQAAKLALYAERDESAIEMGDCPCGAKAAGVVEHDWRISEDGVLAAEFDEYCERCARRVRKREAKKLLKMGIDPRKAAQSVRYHAGKLPAAVEPERARELIAELAKS